MFSVFITTQRQILSLLLLIITGFILNKLKVIKPEARATLSRLSVDVFLPALIFNTMTEHCTPDNLRIYWTYILAGTGFAIAGIFISLLPARLAARGDKYAENLYRYALVIPNTSGIATPIVLALSGTMGYFKYQLLWLPVTYLGFTWALSLIIPVKQKRKTVWEKIRGNFTPALAATLIGSVFGLTGLAKFIPSFAADAIVKLGDCYTGLALIIVGFVIADYSIPSIVCRPYSYIVVFSRLIAIPGIYLLISKLIGLSPELRAMVCLTFACPCGMNSVLFPTAYGQDSEPGASVVMISTVLSVITIPFMYALA